MTSIKKNKTKIIAGVLSLVMAFGVLAFNTPDSIVLTASAMSYDNNGATSFEKDDEIRIINHTREGKNKSDSVYKFDGSDWNPADPDNYIVWEGITDNTFYGVYPATADYDKFTIPTNQSTEQLLAEADWMTDDFTANKSVGKVDFNFQHRLAKVTVNITKWNTEFDGSEEITEPKIYTKGTAVTATYDNSGVTISATGDITEIEPFVDDTSYTAIVAPAKYAITDKFMTFTVDGQKMTVLAKTGTLTDGLEPGKHYTFNLTVGKEAVTIESVTVNGWADGGTIDAGVAEQCTDAIVNLNGKTADIFVPADTPVGSVTEAVRNAVTNGATAIVVSGAVDDECYAAVIEERSEAMVFFKDLEENNYIASNGATYTCVIGSESAEKYVLISTSPRMDWIGNNGNIETIAKQLLPAMVPGSRLLLSTEEAWSVYKPMVETCLDAQSYPWLLGNDKKCYACNRGIWYLTTTSDGTKSTWAWFPVFDVPLS